MNRRHLFFLTFLVAWSCTGKSPAPTTYPLLVVPHIHTIYTNKGCHGDACAYTHYLMLDSFDERRFDDYNFVYLADEYLDTVKTDLPVSGIEFCSPFSFRDIGGSENDEQLEAHAITSISYLWEGKYSKTPEITSIRIWTNGHAKELEWMDTETRKRRTEIR